ncbi:hypothetical protein PPTG_23161 [Phytophthora nicotianae INRA-310]|uniref:MULE transposase domain-containing protein n=1 Tax=Phytophthora nicotianae (strain INRA-310) TaxID=761204 RepID=W2Q3H7_PHYN3|nr:hypothetical protein PPTG_23161 [Phytophthora nicotianae INRA-310]ETN07717.1 hypothetical protein PPTG_23161 [Phytophthora nicotianae INRA-310]
MSGSLHRAPVVGMSRENLSNTTVAERNSRIDKNQSTAVKIPEEWVQYALVDTATNTFAIKVTRCQLEHNHRLNVQSFKSHPSNRVVLEEESMQTSILHFIKDNSESNPTSQDVRNLVRKLKERDARDGPSTAEKRLKKWMKQFGDTPGKGGRIFVDDINQ